MDELAKAMKVIRLKDERYGQYLTAADDKVSITLTVRGSKAWKPKNTEWRLEWLSGPKNLVGEARLWSIYNKVLTFVDNPEKYISKAPDDALTQESWPPAAGEAAAEWRLEISRRNNDPTLFGSLFKMSNDFTKVHSEGLVLTAGRPGTRKKTKFDFNVFFRKSLLQWMNLNTWLVEVVVCRSDFVEYNAPTTAITTTISTPTETDTSDSDDEYHKKGPSTPEIPSNAIKSSTPEVPRNAITSCTPEVPRNAIKSFTPEVPRNAIKSYPPEVPKNAIKSISDAYICNPLKNVLSRWQVGQLYLHMAQNSTEVHASNGYNNTQYCQSGGNVNGSGIQNNGDISVFNNINRGHDNNVKFINYQ